MLCCLDVQLSIVSARPGLVKVSRVESREGEVGGDRLVELFGSSCILEIPASATIEG